MILCLLFAIPAVAPELVCELGNCLLPGIQPAHEACTEDHFINVNLMPAAPLRPPRGRGSLLDAIGSVTDPNCITVLSEFIQQKSPAEGRKWLIGPKCNSYRFVKYALTFEVVRDGDRLKCIRNFYNTTDRCNALLNNRLRFRAYGDTMEVENFSSDGNIIGSMKFVNRNFSKERDTQQCNCEEFEKLINQYLFCEAHEAKLGNSTRRLVAYGIAVGFSLMILVVGAIYFLFTKD